MLYITRPKLLRAKVSHYRGASLYFSHTMRRPFLQQRITGAIDEHMKAPIELPSQHHVITPKILLFSSPQYHCAVKSMPAGAVGFSGTSASTRVECAPLEFGTTGRLAATCRPGFIRRHAVATRCRAPYFARACHLWPLKRTGQGREAAFISRYRAGPGRLGAQRASIDARASMPRAL